MNQFPEMLSAFEKTWFYLVHFTFSSNIFLFLMKKRLFFYSVSYSARGQATCQLTKDRLEACQWICDSESSTEQIFATCGACRPERCSKAPKPDEVLGEQPGHTTVTERLVGIGLLCLCQFSGKWNAQRFTQQRPRVSNESSHLESTWKPVNQSANFFISAKWGSAHKTRAPPMFLLPAKWLSVPLIFCRVSSHPWKN